MLTLGRGSIRYLRNRGLSLGPTRICTGGPEITKGCLESCSIRSVETQGATFDGLLSSARFSNKFYSSSLSCSEVRMSSQVGTDNSGEEEDDLYDGFAQVGTLHDTDDSQNELAPLGTEAEVGEKRLTSTMALAILRSLDLPVGKVLQQWVEEGNEVTRTEVSLAIRSLCKRNMFRKALQLSEWVKSSKHFEFQEANYATHIHLICRVIGPNAAEEYIKTIPESFRGDSVFQRLLSGYVAIADVKKSLEVFERMKKLGFPLTTITCNHLLLLYLKKDKRKIGDVLALMKKENLKPDKFTYWILINAKGASIDIAGMEQLVENMKAEGMEANSETRAFMASIYVKAGVNDKADAILKEMEGDGIENNPWATQYLLPVYAAMGREDEVERIWSIYEPNARINDYSVAIAAWGKLKRIEKAEAAFEKQMKIVKKPFSKDFYPLLKIYADHKMLEKGKDLVKRMKKMGCYLGPPVWDALIKLYIGVGDVDNAVAVLERVTRVKKGMFSSYLSILQASSRKGDVHTAEKMVLGIRRAGYVCRSREYDLLLQAYMKAKTPAYGLVDRMKADNVFLNTRMAKQLADLTILAARKSESADTELLDLL